MADDDADVPDPTDERAPGGEERLTPGEGLATGEDRPTEVAVVEVGGPPAVPWRQRAVAVRSALPQLARNPVVVGASAMVASVALRAAVDVALRAVGSSGSS